MTQEVTDRPRGLRSLSRGFSAASVLSLSRILQLASLFAVTVFLGRAAGPAVLGEVSLVLAAGSVMQAVSVAGLAAAALNALLKRGNDFDEELRIVLYARVLLLPLVFLGGAGILLALPGVSLPPFGVLVFFFVGYAVGAFDVAELAHTARGRFHVIAGRRIAVVAVTAPVSWFFASQGLPYWTLAVLAVESALWQLVLVPGAGISLGPLAQFVENCRRALSRVWEVRMLWASSMVAAVSSRIDLFIIGALLGVHAVGQYSTTSRPIEATTIVAHSLIMVLIGSISKNASMPSQYAASLARASRTTFWTSVVVTGGLVVVGPWLILFLYGQQFETASAILPVYALSVLFIFQEQILSVLLIVEKLYKLDFMINVARATVTIGLNLLLLPTFGIAGAAIAAVLTRPVSTVVILLPHTSGRHVLMLAYGSIFRSNHRVQASANKLIRHRRTKN